MKKMSTIAYCLLTLTGCTPKKRIDDLAFKFCDKVTSSKAEYLKCFTDIVECHNKSSDSFDNDMKFIECARLFQVSEKGVQAFKYIPSLGETDLDEEVWREIENLDIADQKRKNKLVDTEPKAEPKAEPKVDKKIEPAKSEVKPEIKPEPKIEYKEPDDKEIARELPKEVKWKKTERLKKEAEEKAKADIAVPEPQPDTPKPEKKEFDF